MPPAIRISIVLALSIFALSSCAAAPVAVEKPAVVLNKRIVDAPSFDAPAHRESHGSTRWFYTCSPYFRFVPIEKEHGSFQNGTVRIKIRINSLKVQLGLAITILLTRTADAKVEEHELGHTKICTRIYDTAEKAARETGAHLIGKTYEGYGSSDESAVDSAVAKAGEDFCKEYRKGTNDLANAVSAAYDDICNEGGKTTVYSAAVDEAFQRCAPKH